MGFYIMIFSMFAGIAAVAFGLSRAKDKKQALLSVTSIFLGTLFILFAIWLGWPK
ncbi:hypothetical protein SORDD17_01151 [Streptococcus oralis]|uniref:DUF3953 domain-containing protein n=1 Tax=Streptococcus oralis TaxID=1303 RepID=A0A139RKN5_STROR|nr:hypothetical protein [Streptococcus oralis]KXU15333.1 hypothetical protein SORDD17_01151 [Streptococcus oralis]